MIPHIRAGGDMDNFERVKFRIRTYGKLSVHCGCNEIIESYHRANGSWAPPVGGIYYIVFARSDLYGG